MLVITASALAFVMFPSLGGQEAKTGIERSKGLLAPWASAVAASRQPGYAGGSVQVMRENSASIDAEFEKLNGGCDASLAMLQTILRGNDVAARRNAAGVIGELRSGIGTERKDWHQFRSDELQLAARYVIDKDQVTAANATAAFVSHLDGEVWDKWSDFQVDWIQSLGKVEGPQARNLCELFAFTQVPITGAIPGLYRLFQSSDPEQSSWALCAIARAQLMAPTELSETVLANVHSKSDAKRTSAYRNLEMLGSIVWDDSAANRWLQKKIDREPYFLLTSWFGSTMGNQAENTDGLRIKRRKDLLTALEQGLGDRIQAIRFSCTKALIPIGKEVDNELSSGSMIRLHTGKEDVARLLIQSAKAVLRDDPALAKEAMDLATSFDRPRLIG